MTPADTLDLLCPGAPAEIRVLTQERKMLVRRFSDHAEAALWGLSFPDARGVYVVMNPYDEAKIGKDGVDDNAVTRRHWLLIDADPLRDPLANATEEELQRAVTLAQAIRAYLAVHNWPDPVECLSGNGAHLLYRIDLPNEVLSTLLVKDILQHLASTFDNQHVHVDVKVANPSRITKLYGTVTRKGPHSDERPQRTSSITRVPDNLSCVTVEALQQTAKTLPASSPARPQTNQKTPSDKSDPLPQSLPNGNRHMTLFKEGCRLRRLGWNEPEIADALWSLFQHRNTGSDAPRKNIDDLAKDLCQRYTPAQDVFNMSETGDAEFFASCNADLVRYDHRRGRWLLFNGQIWVPQACGEINRLALETVRARQVAALQVTDTDQRLKRLKWAGAGEARSRQTNLLAIAQNVEPLADSGDNWDTDPWLLGAMNGVVDLKTGQLRDGRPEDRVTMRVRVAFDPRAQCPLWDTTVAQIFNNDQALIQYFDCLVGYSLTGDCREEILALCWGTGANGKGTLMNTLGWMLGDYADDLPFSTLELHDRTGIPNDIAKIVGKRFVTSSESGEAKRLNEARVKALTGRDPMTARFLHQEFFTFQPVAKFWLATNHKPDVRDDSVGFWRRLKMIPFTQSFDGSPNLQLKDKLKEEAPGILARAVKGCLTWQKHGLNEPAAVKGATALYRTESLPIARFLEECCVEKEGLSASFGQLFGSYKHWCGSVREVRLGRHKFSEALHDRFQIDTKDTQRVTFLDVGIIDEYAQQREPGDEQPPF
jgi:putative DNA primase/helicase